MWITPEQVIELRSKNGRELAHKFPEMYREDWTEFVEDAYDAGFEFCDFITLNEMWEELQKMKQNSTT